jgi:hypothetical protein
MQFAHDLSIDFPPPDDMADACLAEVCRRLPPGFMARRPERKQQFLLDLLAGLTVVADVETRMSKGKLPPHAGCLSVSLGLNGRDGIFAPGSPIGYRAGRPLIDAMVAAGYARLSKGYEVRDAETKKVIRRRASRLYPGHWLTGYSMPPSDRKRVMGNNLPKVVSDYLGWVNKSSAHSDTDSLPDSGIVHSSPHSIRHSERDFKSIDGTDLSHYRSVVHSPSHYSESYSEIDQKEARRAGPYTVCVSRITWHGQPFKLQLHRGKCGRLYGSYQNRNQQERLEEFEIAGQPVAEVDFACEHLAILYASKRIQLVGDAYEVEVGREFRQIVKRLTNALLNANSVTGACSAIRNQLYSEGADVKLIERLMGVTLFELAVRIIAKHAPIRGAFGKGVGRLLQWIDSEIMIRVLVACRAANLVALPIHDSVLVRADRAAEAAAIMQRAFKEFTGFEIEVKTTTCSSSSDARTVRAVKNAA